MADNPQTSSAIYNALALNFRDRIVKTSNRMSVLLRTLPVRRGAGKTVAVDVEFDGMVAENFSDGDDAANFGSDAVVPALLGWGLYRANFRVTDLARAVAASSASPQGMVALMGHNMVNASSKLASTLNAAGHTGAGTGSTMSGLGVALAADNTYMGIDRTNSSYAGFRANVIDPGTPTAPTLDLIRGDINDTIYTACGEQPDLAFCRPKLFNKLGSLFTELRRYSQPVTEINTAKGRVTLDASVGAIEFEGCTFIKDKDCPANTIEYVNSAYCSFEYLPQSDEGVLNAQAQAMNVNLSDGYGPIPLGARYVRLAKTGASEKVSIQVFMNLVVEKPIACGIRKNVSES